MGAPPRRLVAVGGGAKNPLWLQIVSDVSGLPQDVPERTIGASYGDAFMAGLATGIVAGPGRVAARLGQAGDEAAAEHWMLTGLRRVLSGLSGSLRVGNGGAPHAGEAGAGLDS